MCDVLSDEVTGLSFSNSHANYIYNFICVHYTHFIPCQKSVIVKHSDTSLIRNLQLYRQLFLLYYDLDDIIINTENVFQGWRQNLYFNILWQVNLFSDMQSKFQNKAVLSKKTREVHFIASLNIFSDIH
jgi:hypothetical protein